MAELPTPGSHFKRKGRREVFTCIEVREHDVLCFGGSPNPWGKRSVRSFAVDEEFVVVQEAKQDA